jgi:hypothetical protein
VANDYAEELRFPDDRIRMRRDHKKYLTLIDAVAFARQYQRPLRRVKEKPGGQEVEVEYIEVALEDIALANRLAHEVLGRTLDELAPQTRRLLLQLDSMAKQACERLRMTRRDYRFSRKEVRQATGWSQEQLQRHLGRLVELEYLLVHRG